ncbi:MAG TPA: S8 family serine peptidase [Streptosporangiaceae bacterium]|nr:S8 family serine peptidase [Streptosporangiaceae bacterium]
MLIRRWVALGLVTLGLSLPAGMMAVPAHAAPADQVRNAQAWVLATLGVQRAWQVTRGAGVTVAVIDSGVNPHVSDLAGSVIPRQPDFTGVGTRPSNPNWGQHGTWMASLIAGHGHAGGGSGIIGVAPRARVLSIRVITDPRDPGYHAYQHESTTRVQNSLAAAIRYATAHGAGVISMSIGYGGPSRAVRSALQQAYDHGVVVLASAGNSGRPAARVGRHAPYSFPADYPGVLAVGASNASGAAAGFSSENISVQLTAPGVSVPAQGRDGQYWLVSGTSPACALAAGVAALIKSADPRLPPALVEYAMTSTTRNHPPGGYNDSVGFGTVNAPAALAAARRLSHQVPATGLAVSASFGGGRAAVPPAPIGRRGPGMLVLFALLAAASLGLALAAARIIVLRRLGAR